MRNLLEDPSGATAPDVPSRGVLATSLFWTGEALYRLNRFDEAFKVHQEAKAIHEELAKAEPGNVDTQRELALDHNDIGRLLFDSKRHAEALEAFEECRRINQALAKAHPDVAEYQAALAKFTAVSAYRWP